MNKSRASCLKKLINEQNMDLLIAIRNRYGIKTARMNRRQIEKAAKSLWNECKGDWSKIGKNKTKPILTRAKIKEKKQREIEALKKTKKLAESFKANGGK